MAETRHGARFTIARPPALPADATGLLRLYPLILHNIAGQQLINAPHCGLRYGQLPRGPARSTEPCYDEAHNDLFRDRTRDKWVGVLREKEFLDTGVVWCELGNSGRQKFVHRALPVVQLDRWQEIRRIDAHHLWRAEEKPGLVCGGERLKPHGSQHDAPPMQYTAVCDLGLR